MLDREIKNKYRNQKKLNSQTKHIKLGIVEQKIQSLEDINSLENLIKEQDLKINIIVQVSEKDIIYKLIDCIQNTNNQIVNKFCIVIRYLDIFSLIKLISLEIFTFIRNKGLNDADLAIMGELLKNMPHLKNVQVQLEQINIKYDDKKEIIFYIILKIVIINLELMESNHFQTEYNNYKKWKSQRLIYCNILFFQIPE